MLLAEPGNKGEISTCKPATKKELKKIIQQCPRTCATLITARYKEIAAGDSIIVAFVRHFSFKTRNVIFKLYTSVCWERAKTVTTSSGGFLFLEFTKIVIARN
jgi:hypothetical protein